MKENVKSVSTDLELELKKYSQSMQLLHQTISVKSAVFSSVSQIIIVKR